MPAHHTTYNGKLDNYSMIEESNIIFFYEKKTEHTHEYGNLVYNNTRSWMDE